jgi:beta-galactosidase
VLVSLGLGWIFATTASADFVWVEGETARASAVAGTVQGANFPELLSGRQWLVVNPPADSVPASGATLQLDLVATKAGRYRLWARTGFEWARSPFHWRLGSGEWSLVPNTKPTIHPQRLGFWSEVGWLDLGLISLIEGKQTVEFRVEPKNDKGERLFALDAMVAAPDGWTPEGTLKPGEDYVQPLDLRAKGQIFQLPGSEEAARSRVELTGAWQVARWDDPNPDLDASQPVQKLPNEGLRWQGVMVPSFAWNKPELSFASRLIYRTRVQIPADQGRGHRLHFSGSNWIASVFVNGQFVGSHRSVWVPWSIDLSRFIRPGEVHEIAVAIKGPYYAFDTAALKSTLLQLRNMPPEDPLRFARWIAPIYPSSKGEGEGHQTGLVNPVTLESTGSAYVTDAFVRPQVGNKRIDADLEILNPTDQSRALEVISEAVRDGKVEKRLPPVQLQIAANGKGQAKVGDAWENPALWWPVDRPEMYTLRTTVRESGKVVDIHEQRFGFREVSTQGRRILINGVARNFWNWVEVSGRHSSADSWKAQWKAEGNRFHRFSWDHRVAGIPSYREAQLKWADENGLPGRLSTCIDGMFITFDLQNPIVWEHFGEHLRQVARAYRNHPSVIVYSAENELMYINAQNLGQVESVTPRMRAIIDGMRAVDPTRPIMVDGGGALDGSLPVDCPHYPEARSDHMPRNAFSLEVIADHSKRWPWDRNRPMVVGETFFYAGKLEDQAWIGGDDVFRGRESANRGAAKYVRLLVEGFRWAQVAGICPWVAHERVIGAEKSFAEIAVFSKRRAYRVFGGRSVKPELRVFNDSLSTSPISVNWSWTLGDKQLAQGEQRLTITPGESLPLGLELASPKVTSKQVARLKVRATQDGAQAFEDEFEISVLPEVPRSTSKVLVQVVEKTPVVSTWLKQLGYSVNVASSFKAVAPSKGVLVIAPHAISADEAVSPALTAFAASGGKVVVLDQQNPLTGPGLPIAVRSTQRAGGYAFGQGASLDVLRNLGPTDFVDWHAEGPTFDRVYQKPATGARSLIECGDGLNFSALFEVPVGEGAIFVSQLRFGANLNTEPAAQVLLANLIEVAAEKQSNSGTVAIVGEATPAVQAARATGLRTAEPSTVREALDARSYPVLALAATAENLRALGEDRGRLDRYLADGGWIMAMGLQPSDVEAFNNLVGVNHIMRPFRVERVTLEAPNHPLMATLGNRDFTYYSPQEIMFGDYWLSEHVYSHVVSGEDVAPFAQMPDGPADPMEYKPTFSDNDPYNYVNGLLNSDSWRTIRQIGIRDDRTSDPLVFRLRRPETLRQINIWNNTNYMTIEDLEIVVDDDTANPVVAKLPPNGDRVEIPIHPPRPGVRRVSIRAKSVRGEFQIRDGVTLKLAGIDNVQFLRVPDAKEGPKTQFLDNVGGLVAYPRGKGGFLLNQLKFGSDDPNPLNAQKKSRMLTTLLTNLGIGGSAQTPIVAGLNVDFSVLEITRWCNRHIKAQGDKPGWFGDASRDLRQLVAGEQFYGDVPFRVSDYTNAPIPQSIVLDQVGARVESLPISGSVDMLYLLHTANVKRAIADWERGDRNFLAPEVAKYRIEYEDGSEVFLPIRLGEEIDHWISRSPSHLPNSIIAWSAAIAGHPEEKSVIFRTSWQNPKPSIGIRRVDLISGTDIARADYALLAITVGRRKSR